MTFPFQGESKVLDDDARSKAPGKFIQLSDGITHYEHTGLQDGQVVVLIHGFSVPYIIFDPNFHVLAQAGFHTLRYDLFGRGWSDRPDVNYDVDFFVRQLRELLDRLGHKNVSLIGLSMGGPIAAGFARRHPQDVKKIVLIDPVGAQPIAISKLLGTAKIPFLGELVIGLFGTQGMLKSLTADFLHPILVSKLAPGYLKQMQFKGFKRAILSSLRNDMLGSCLGFYEELGKSGIPVLLIWGREDRTVPFSQHDTLCQVIPQAEFHAIEKSGHIPHYERSNVVNPLLIQFLK